MNLYFRNGHSVMGSSKFSWMSLQFLFGTDFSYSKNSSWREDILLLPAQPLQYFACASEDAYTRSHAWGAP